MSSKQIAQVILNQMGGTRRLEAMTGAKDFLALDNGVQFSFAKAIAGINRVIVTLRADDLYDIEFGVVKKNRVTKLPEYTKRDETTGVYMERLKPIFERATGFFLSI